MEPENHLFGLSIDPTAKTHLLETAKWARFLAVIGFISLALVVIFSIVVAVSGPSSPGNSAFNDESYSAGYLIGTVIGSLIVVLLYFFPCYFLLQFANKMKISLLADDMVAMNDAFRNLKATFRYMGIMTIIFIVLFGLGMLAGITGG